MKGYASGGIKKGAQKLIRPAEASSNAGSAKPFGKSVVKCRTCGGPHLTFQHGKITKTAGQTGKIEQSLSNITLSNSTGPDQQHNNRNFGRGPVNKDGIVVRVEHDKLFVSCSDGSEMMVAKRAINRRDLKKVDDNIAFFKGKFRSTIQS